MDLYKIIAIQDIFGEEKKTTLDHEKLIGYFLELDTLRSYVISGYNPVCHFVWNDDSGKMMVTSRVQEMSEFGNKIKITTQNSIYLFEKI